MAFTFAFADVFNQNIGSWNTAQVTDTRWMFAGAMAFNQNIGGWNTVQVTNMARMFAHAIEFNQDIGSWNTAQVTDMSEMFYSATKFNQDISSWNTSQVTNMSNMFVGAVAFNQDVGEWHTEQVTNMSGMFAGASAFDQDLSGLEIQNVYTMRSMLDGSGLSTGNYDATLLGWYQQAMTLGVQYGVYLGAAGLTFSSASIDERNNLVDRFGWIIAGDSYVNTMPTGAVTISGTAREDSTLTAVTSAIADADGLGSFSYQWLADGIAIAGATASTLTLGQAQVGREISVRVSYTDGQSTAESLTSAATAAVQNVNDLPTGAVTISGTATQGVTLTADTSALDDADGLGTLSYQWKANSADIMGAISSSYTLTQDEVGKVITVVVSYTDAQGTSESVLSTATAAVENVNDDPTGTVTIAGTPMQGQTC